MKHEIDELLGSSALQTPELVPLMLQRHIATGFVSAAVLASLG